MVAVRVSRPMPDTSLRSRVDRENIPGGKRGRGERERERERGENFRLQTHFKSIFLFWYFYMKIFYVVYGLLLTKATSLFKFDPD